MFVLIAFYHDWIYSSHIERNWLEKVANSWWCDLDDASTNCLCKAQMLYHLGEATKNIYYRQMQLSYWLRKKCFIFIFATNKKSRYQLENNNRDMIWLAHRRNCNQCCSSNGDSQEIEPKCRLRRFNATIHMTTWIKFWPHIHHTIWS